MLIVSKVNGCMKTDSTGKVIKYEARVAVQGFSQKKNIDYPESYAPVVFH